MVRPALFSLLLPMLAAVTLAAVTLAAVPAGAEPPRALTLNEARDAIAIYNEGKRLQEKGDLEGAIMLFREADAMYPGALPKYRAAVCLDALERTKEALAAYRAFLAFAESPKHDDLIALVRTRLSALEAPQKKSAQKKTVRVASNVARARGRTAETHRDVHASDDNPLPMRVTGFVLLGATLGAGAAFAATYAQSRLAESEPDRQRFGTIAGVMAPVTAALALGTVIVLPLSFRSDDRPKDKEPKTGAFVAPYAGPASAGFVGRF